MLLTDIRIYVSYHSIGDELGIFGNFLKLSRLQSFKYGIHFS